MTLRNSGSQNKLQYQSIGLSRRGFLKTVAVSSALGAVLTEQHLAWAQLAVEPEGPEIKPLHVPNGAVLINANENPMGPCRAARVAIAEAASLGGRYDLNGETEQLTQVFCEQNTLKPDYVTVYAGSSEPLHFASLAFCSPARGYVFADPAYEAGARAARLALAPVKAVKLREDFSHDVKAMAAADPKAGLIYVVNPNNPTGTLTTYKDIVWLLDNKPKGSVLLVDEAYIHLSDAPSVIDQVKLDKEIIVLRSFSKIYGMAGIRCGLAIARPDLLAKLAAYGVNSMPITSCAAARASLLDVNLVTRRRKSYAAVRDDLFTWMKQNGYTFTPSVSNCFMVDVKRPGEEVVIAMQQRNVYIGRVWPIWPDYVRITIGSAADMESFKSAFQDVMQNKPRVPVIRDIKSHLPL